MSELGGDGQQLQGLQDIEAYLRDNFAGERVLVRLWNEDVLDTANQPLVLATFALVFDDVSYDLDPAITDFGEPDSNLGRTEGASVIRLYGEVIHGEEGRLATEVAIPINSAVCAEVREGRVTIYGTDGFAARLEYLGG